MTKTCDRCKASMKLAPKDTRSLFCSTCQEWMRVYDLRHCNRCSRFRLSKEFTSTGAWCKNCRYSYNLIYHGNRKGKKSAFVLDRWAEGKTKQAHNRALKKALPATITSEDVLNVVPADGKCPVLGIPLEFEGKWGSRRDAWASVDRIVPEKGYVPGNIRIISFLANRIKYNANADQILAVGHDLKRIEALTAA